MAAEATFKIGAVDATKAAFASVQNNLNRLTSSGNNAGKSLLKGLDIRHAMSAVAIAVGISMDKIAEKIARLYTGTSEAQDKLDSDLAAASDEAFASQKALISSRQTDEQKLNTLLAEQVRLKKQLNSAGGDTASQITAKKAESALNANLISQAQIQDKIDKDKASLQDDITKSMERLGASEQKLYIEKIPVAEKINRLEERKSELMFATEAQILNGGKISAMTDKEMIDHRNKLATVNEQLLPLYEEQSKLLYEQGQLGRDAAEMIAYGFEDAILSGEKLSDVLKALGQDLIRLMFRNLITAPLAGALGTLFTGRASGGPVAGNSPYIVGESGPEMFVPASGGKIIPNHQLGSGSSAGGGGGITINYNIASGVSRADLAPILDQERKRLKSEIPDMVRRGGAYRAAFA